MVPTDRKLREATLVVALVLGCCLPAGVSTLAGPVLEQEKPSIVTVVPGSPWQVPSSRITDPVALGPWGGDPAVEREYGVTSFTTRTCEFEGHTARALIEQAPDASSAYGLWTFYRSEAMTPVAGMPLTVAGPRGALLARGSLLIRVAWTTAEGAHSEPYNYRAMLQTLGGLPRTSRSLEQLPPALPSRGLVQGSVKYVLGPVAAARVLPSFPVDLYGFEHGAEVQAARYSYDASSKLTLAAINYPTPQIARAAFDSISAALGASAAGNASAFECRRQDTYVLVVTDADSRAAANRFLDQFKVSKQMTEDEPPETDERAEALRLVRLLIANGALIMELLILSVAGGVVVFVSKRLARKWFSDSSLVEGQPGGIIVLNLNRL